MSDEKHTCHAFGCDQACPPKYLMCRRHWFMVPPDLRSAVWREHRPGQEVDKRPSRAWLKAAVSACIAVAVKEKLFDRSEAVRGYKAFLARLNAIPENVDPLEALLVASQEDGGEREGA